MALVPASYNARSLFVRRASTLFTVVGIAATVAVLAGVLALQRGFAALFAESGREDVVVFLRPGATSEGESAFQRERAQILIKNVPEIAQAEEDRPLASAETYLAVRLYKIDGGETNVPIRGVSSETFEIREGDGFRIVEGKRFAPGADEVIVGRSLLGRIRDCGPGQTMLINTTPFRVVGAFACEGPFESEVWGDLERIGRALERPVYSRVVAKLAPGSDVEALAERLANDKQVPAKVQTERAYLASQSTALSTTLLGLGSFLAVVMGAAAVFTGTNAMLAAISARTHEIGVLLALGFRPFAVFLSFLLEAAFIGLLGGIAGALLALPLNGIRTGTTNWNTFTEVAFAFRVSPDVLVTAIVFALVLGLLGGAWPAWRAARLHPTEAFRRG